MEKAKLRVVDGGDSRGEQLKTDRPAWRDKHGRRELWVNPELFADPAVPRVVKRANQDK